MLHYNTDIIKSKRLQLQSRIKTYMLVNKQGRFSFQQFSSFLKVITFFLLFKRQIKSRSLVLTNQLPAQVLG